MNLYCLLAIPFVFVAWYTYERRKHSKINSKASEDFWRRDSEANFVRKVNLDTVEYIHIPLDSLPFGVSDNPEIIECERIIKELADKRILNLTGKTSTDLKFMYGVANLETVSQYDDNYTLMVKTINSWGHLLYENGLINEAVTVLEYGIDSLSDITANYKLLSQLYVDTMQAEKLDYLITTADKLNSLSKPVILNHLNLVKSDHEQP